MKREKKFRKKPVVIEAFQFTDESKDAAYRWASSHQMNIDPSFDDHEGPILSIPTLEGEMICRIGDWIIRGVNGEFYPCKPDIFEKTYEPVTPSSATAEEILVKHGFFLMTHKNSNEEVRKAFIEPVLSAMTEFAAQQVAEATKDCYPKTFTKWFRSDEFYEIFNEGTDNEGLIQWEYMSSGQILDTLDELLDYWTNNIEQ